MHNNIAKTPARHNSALVAGVLLLATVAGVSPTPALAQKSGTDATAVGTDTVISETARQSVTAIGRLVAARAGVVSAQAKGPVQSITARVGDRVDKGDEIARLGDGSLKWLRELAQAEMLAAKARSEHANVQARLRTQELKRLEDLKSSAAFSPARFEDAALELAKAESAAAEAGAVLKRATASLKLAEIDLANARIRAPYPGVITKLHTEAGSYLAVGQAVASMVSYSDTEIEASVPAQRASGLEPGTVVTFTLGSSSVKGSAIVRAVVPEEDPLTRTRAVRFTPADDSILAGAAANQGVTLSIPAGPAHEVTTVHKDAVINKGGKQVVFVVEDGTADIRPVNLGDALGQRFTVIGGLKPGDVVVVRGNERLRPGQKVTTGNGGK